MWLVVFQTPNYRPFHQIECAAEHRYKKVLSICFRVMIVVIWNQNENVIRSISGIAFMCSFTSILLSYFRVFITCDSNPKQLQLLNIITVNWSSMDWNQSSTRRFSLFLLLWIRFLYKHDIWIAEEERRERKQITESMCNRNISHYLWQSIKRWNWCNCPYLK